MIACESLGKTFKSYQKDPGILGSIKSFFDRKLVEKHAIDDFSVLIEPGEMLGLLGQNGAGKTTLMKMFTGIIVPSRGDLRIYGERPSDRSLAFRRRIALVMGQKSQLWWDIPAMDSFLLLQKYYEIPDQQFKARLGELAERLDVSRLLKVHVRKLSLGERMKMELIASLLHKPDLIFLDEPTIGLDLIAQNNIRNFVAEYQKDHNATVLLTSHYMADVAALCSRVVLVLDGKKGFDGPISQFETILGKEKFLSLSFSTPVDQSDVIWQGLDARWHGDGRKVDLRIPEVNLRDIAARLLHAFPVTDIATEKLPIERVMDTILKNPKLLDEHRN